jgi:IS1 family transposase
MHCPKCYSTKIKKNGFTHYGKQNNKCLKCGSQFVENSKHFISKSRKEMIKRALKERLSLRSISRIFKVSLTWLQAFSVQVWSEAPDDLAAKPSMLQMKDEQELQDVGIQIDEMWSFVGNKQQKAWIWIAYDQWHKQVITFHVGNRTKKDAKILWNKIPEKYREHCCFDTDQLKAYQSVIPQDQHYTKKILTQALERFNCTVRQRCSRMVRKTISFSKNWNNHILALRYFFWQFNLEQQALHL